MSKANARDGSEEVKKDLFNSMSSSYLNSTSHANVKAESLLSLGRIPCRLGKPLFGTGMPKFVDMGGRVEDIQNGAAPRNFFQLDR